MAVLQRLGDIRFWLSWPLAAASLGLCLLLVQAPAAAQSVEEQREKDYLEDIIRDDEDVSTKTKPHEKSGTQPEDPFADSIEGKPEGEVAPEDREKIQVQDDLRGEDTQELTKAQKHEAGVYVSERLDRKLKEIEGKVPEAEVEHYLVYSPSPAARGNPAIKAYERKVWQQALRDHRSAQMQKRLLAELDQGSAGELPKGQAAGQGENPLGGVGSLAELFGRGSNRTEEPKAESADAAAGAEAPTTGTAEATATAAADAEERTAEAKDQAAVAKDQMAAAGAAGSEGRAAVTKDQVAAAGATEAEEQGLPGPENRILDVSLPAPKDGPTSGKGPAPPATASESFGEAVAQSGIPTDEDAATEDGASAAAAAPETEIATVRGESGAGQPSEAAPLPPQPPAQGVTEGSPAPAKAAEPPSGTPTAPAEEPQNFASRFALDEELRRLDNTAEGGGAAPPTVAQQPEDRERQRLEETLAVLKWQRNLADPDEAAANPLTAAEIAAIERAQGRSAESVPSTSPEDQRLKEKAELLASLEEDSEKMESELAGSPAAQQRLVIGAATREVAETAGGQLRYRPAYPDDPVEFRDPESQFGFDALLRSLRLRLLHAQANNFLQDCRETDCQLPGKAVPSTANETQQSRS